MAPSRVFPLLLSLLVAVSSANAYFLMASKNMLSVERLDPLISPGNISGHVHAIVGGSGFRPTTNTEQLRKSQCTTMPIPEDKSNYWFSVLYFQWRNGSFSSVTGGFVVYYLFSDTPGTTTAFPDNMRIFSGDPTLRTYNSTSYAQQAITFLCLDFNGVSTRHNELPSKPCPSGIRSQVNLPSCWDGKNVDSPDHKSHTAFPSGGPDSGTCSDPKFPITLPRIFIEVYWQTSEWEAHRSEAMDTTQPFVYSYGDRTGYGYHADFINGWKEGVLQKVVDECHLDPNGDPTACANAGIFTFEKNGAECHITPQVDEVVTGTLPKLPGNNAVQTANDTVNGHVPTPPAHSPAPAFLSPVSVYAKDPPAGACQVGDDIGSQCHRTNTSTALLANTNSSATGAPTQAVPSISPRRENLTSADSVSSTPCTAHVGAHAAFDAVPTSPLVDEAICNKEKVHAARFSHSHKARHGRFVGIH